MLRKDSKSDDVVNGGADSGAVVLTEAELKQLRQHLQASAGTDGGGSDSPTDGTVVASLVAPSPQAAADRGSDAARSLGSNPASNPGAAASVLAQLSPAAAPLAASAAAAATGTGASFVPVQSAVWNEAVIGSSSTPSPVPVVQPNAIRCCGTCGYVNCRAQILGEGNATAGPSQLTGSLLVPFMDYYATTPLGNMHPSVSAAMPSLDQLSTAILPPLGTPVQTPTPVAPAVGGGSATTTATQSGTLTGSVTSGTTQSLAAAAAPTSTNPIVLENQKPGNPESEWGIDGNASTNIEGFTTDISVNHGTPISFKINTDSNNYRIDIYRLGYYGGMGARKVATLQHTGVQSQPAPLRDPKTGEVDAGNWGVSATWNVPGDAVSGVYIAKLVRQDGTFGENEIPFVVRDDSSHSDIVFQTSDETWQAYNGWGGANFYGGNGPATDQNPGRAYAVSYNRPITTRDGGGTFSGPQDYVFGAEYAGISWLEQNGYDVSYMAGVDADRYGSLLLNHKTYVDAGHDEYWSGQQRTNVEAARDAGVNLEFWSGNEVYWKTRWGNALSADATAYRTLISYKETWSNADIDPSNQWTGTFRDPRYVSATAQGGGRPENALTGTIFQVDSYRSDAITIPYDDANLRFWRNTSVANLQAGQTATLTQNYLGYEWDEAPDNGFDPAGLVRLSSTTLPVDTYLLDYGNTTGANTATHSLTLYRAPSGALVFGAGTVYWSWGLSDNHDNAATPTNPRVQQAMVNLFADMGIQPGTLQSGLVAGTASSDRTAPVSVVTQPGSVKAGDYVTVTGTASDLGGGVVAGVEVSTDNGVSWHPATGDETWTYTWTPQVAGTYTIKSRAVDDSINLETPSAGRTVNVAAPNFVSLFPGSASPAVVNTTDSGAVELGVKFQTSVAGSATGIRYYKSSQDIGVHTGELWSSTGTKLATVTFTNETQSGWQTALFSSPVTLTPGAVYTASYHTNAGHYSNTENYFTSNLTNGPLTAPAAGNGVYAYGSTSLYPTNSDSGTNFWVDVTFVPAAGTANQPPTAVDDSGSVTSRDTAITFAASSLVANDTDPNGDTLTVTGANAAVNGTVSFNTQTNLITFTPTAGYTGAASFSYAISDGRGGTASAKVNLTVVAPGLAPVSLFTSANTPAQTALNDGQAVEVGTKFQSSAAGQISALKFYRSASDTGPDILDLWSATGTKLASATFSNTAASGWQTVLLAAPVAITAGTTYVAAVHTNGSYVATSNYFSSAVTSGPLTALADAGSGGNGVYAYGAASLFPTNSFDAANYWVDVVYNPPTSTNRNPVAGADPAATTLNTPVTILASTLLANDTDPDGDTLTITGVTNGANGTATFNTAANSVTFAPATGYTGNAATFTYTVSDGKGGTAIGTVTVNVTATNAPPLAKAETLATSRNVALSIPTSSLLANDTDADGDVLTVTGVTAISGGTVSLNTTTKIITFTPTTGSVANASFSYTVSDGRGGSSTVTDTVTIAPNDAPVAVNDTGYATAQATPIAIAAASLLANDTDKNGDPLSITAVTATAGGSVAYNSSTKTVTFTPTTGFSGPAGFNYTISDSNGGTASASVSLTVAPPPATGVNLFSATDLPNTTPDGDTAQVNLGMKFTASASGTITGIRYYKSATDTGVHTGSLYSTTGAVLATGTFTNETASGWQTLTFATPVAIAAGTTYVASYHSNGHYIANSNYFTAAKTTGPLTAPAAGNGVYTYGTGSALPTSTFRAANYWVDVYFNQGGSAPNVAPVANNDGPYAVTVNTPLTINVANLLANDTDANGDTLSVTGASGATHGTVAFDATAKTITFTPTTAYTGAATFAYTITDGKSASASATVSLTVGGASAPTQSFFTSATTPATPKITDASVELGMRFTADVAGSISGIEFYKAAGETGTHSGKIWQVNADGTGTLLGSLAFTGETASGWQTASFASGSTVAIAKGTTYVVSYHANAAYAATSNFFATPLDSGNLHAAAGASGVYAYGSTSAFPTSSFNQSNYYVDVAFKPTLVS